MYIEFNGQWCYLYLAVDSVSNTVDFCSPQLQRRCGATFFRTAIYQYGQPEVVTLDKLGSTRPRWTALTPIGRRKIALTFGKAYSYIT
ncbi:DDE-type integrase/transposase/recombinase [Serratia quinivorans]